MFRPSPHVLIMSYVVEWPCLYFNGALPDIFGILRWSLCNTMRCDCTIESDVALKRAVPMRADAFNTWGA